MIANVFHKLDEFLGDTQTCRVILGGMQVMVVVGDGRVDVGDQGLDGGLC